METLTQKEVQTIEAAGFSIDKAGKVREGGRLIAAAEVAQIIAGNIVGNVDFAALRKSKARKAAAGGKTLAQKLDDISPAIGLLRVGKIARLSIPKTAADGKDPLRAFVMGIVTKLNHITAEGGDWAGRKFDTMSDDSKEFLYVSRLPDVTPHVRRTGGGRKPGTVTSDNSKDRLASALASSREHLNGKDEGQQANDQVDAVINGGVAESGTDGPAIIDPVGDNQPPVEQQEDATLIRS